MTLDRMHPTVLRFGNAARARFGKITAFRLGYMAGETRQYHASPYTDARGRELYQIGVDAARESMERRERYDRESEKED